MKAREPRRNVMLAARMRHSNAWSDANILNISSRGLALHSVSPPLRGTYVEVRRGAHTVVGRVIWANAYRFGVCAQDRLAIDSLISNEGTDKQAANGTADVIVERRTCPCSDGLERRCAQSRDQGRALQFAFIVGMGFVLAACAYDAVVRTLSQPLSIVTTQLAHTLL